MFSFVIKRMLMILPTLFGVSVIAFGLIRLVPGDPVLMMIGERGASPEAYAQMKANLGLDKPILVQYGKFVSHAIQLDFGTSIISRRPVIEEFTSRFPATLELGLFSSFFAILIGIPVGLLAAIRRNTWVDYSVMGASLIGYSMPIFWWGLILILFFSIHLGITPVSGRIAMEYDIPSVTGFLLIDTWLIPGAAFAEKWQAFVSSVRHLALPTIALGTIPLATIARMTRSSMLEVLGEDYIRTAKAKGLSRPRIVWIHALKNALVPVVTIIGLILGSIVTGAILTETLFSWPGIGKWLIQSVTSRDYPVIQAGILITSVMIIFVNMLVDLAYAWVNPRMRIKT